MKRNYDKYKQNYFSFPFRSGVKLPDDDENDGSHLKEEDFLDESPDYASMSGAEMKEYRDRLSAEIDAERARHDELTHRYAEARRIERESYLQKKTQGTMHTSGILLEIMFFALGIGIGQLIIWAIRG